MKKQCCLSSCKAVLDPGKRFYCSQCRRAVYCDKECQCAAWPEHRKTCQEDSKFQKQENGLLKQILPNFARPACGMALLNYQNGKEGGVFFNINHLLEKNRETGPRLVWCSDRELIDKYHVFPSQIQMMKESRDIENFVFGIIMGKMAFGIRLLSEKWALKQSEK